LIDSLKFWYSAVESYSTRALTFEEDRLPALAGIAARIAQALGPTYVAGLWKEDITYGLCWEALKPSERRERRRGGGSPSWSWISSGGVQGPQELIDRRGIDRLEVCGIHVEEEHPGSFRRILNGGRLEIKGEIWKADIRSEKSGLSDSQTAYVHPGPGFFHSADECDKLDFRSDSYPNAYQYQRQEVECWLLLVRQGRSRKNFEIDDVVLSFLVLERAEGVDSVCGEACKRIGIAEHTIQGDWRDIGLMVPGQQPIVLP